ncbi:MAG: hypothetical protein IJ856_07070 [Candidatus Methanomethylophilaceae archaeon]|nr:hypothetical protein [Candidatus Methanomethylophilaceae archaeon]
MNKNALLAITAIAVIAVACIAAYAFLKSDDSTSLRTDLKAGDYIEIRVDNQGSTYTERYEIQSVSGSSCSVSHMDRDDITVEKMTRTGFLDKILLSSENISDYGAQKNGTETIDTPWGKVKCTIYTVPSYTGITLYVGPGDVVYKEVSSIYTRTLSGTSLF